MLDNQQQPNLPDIPVPVLFRVRPLAVPPELRPVWRIAALLLMLAKCRGERASLPQLHVLNSAMTSVSNHQAVKEALSGNPEPDRFTIRFDPAINHAAELAAGEELIAWEDGKRIRLLDRGRRLLEEILRSDQVLTTERRLLDVLPGKLTQTHVDELLNWARRK